MHSLHAYFIRPGDPEHPDRVRGGPHPRRPVVHHPAGRGGAARKGDLRAVGVVPAGRAGGGARGADAGRAGPGDAADAGRDHARVRRPARRDFARLPRPIDIRYVTDPPWERADRGPSEARSQVWMRADGRLPDDELLHVCVLTYASDMTLLDSVLVRHGAYWGLDKVLGREPGPRAVVPPAVPRGRVVPLRLRLAECVGGARPGDRPVLRAGRHADRDRRPGRPAANSRLRTATPWLLVIVFAPARIGGFLTSALSPGVAVEKRPLRLLVLLAGFVLADRGRRSSLARVLARRRAGPGRSRGRSRRHPRQPGAHRGRRRARGQDARRRAPSTSAAATAASSRPPTPSSPPPPPRSRCSGRTTGSRRPSPAPPASTGTPSTATSTSRAPATRPCSPATTTRSPKQVADSGVTSVRGKLVADDTWFDDDAARARLGLGRRAVLLQRPDLRADRRPGHRLRRRVDHRPGRAGRARQGQGHHRPADRLRHDRQHRHDRRGRLATTRSPSTGGTGPTSSP